MMRERSFSPFTFLLDDQVVYRRDLYPGAFQREEQANKPQATLTLAEEFEQLRRSGPKYSMAQRRRMSHLEYHLDQGDLVCNCGD